jgi:hypothetical protein
MRWLQGLILGVLIAVILQLHLRPLTAGLVVATTNFGWAVLVTTAGQRWRWLGIWLSSVGVGLFIAGAMWWWPRYDRDRQRRQRHRLSHHYIR